jgi:ubiquinol-cytochrome c reductase cytochrome b subunit
VAVVFAAGSVDRLFFQFGFGDEGAVWFFRGAFLLVPALVYWVTRRLCVELARENAHHPLRGWDGEVLARNARGGFQPLEQTSHSERGERISPPRP